jgi:hypothetical protein
MPPSPRSRTPPDAAFWSGSGVRAGTIEAFEQLDELLVALGASVGRFAP